MKGRWPGVLLLVLAVTVVVAGHGVWRAAAAGTALPITVTGPPRIGDCVLSAPDPAAPLAAVGSVDQRVVFGPCNGAVAGEVVSVRPGRPPAPDLSIGAVMGTSGDCWAQASRYVGFATAGGVASLPTAASRSIDWHPELTVRGQRLGSDALQDAVGRGWSACVVRPENLDLYLGSVRGVLRSGVAPAEYGDCSPSEDPAVLSSVACANPHPVERLGWALVPRSVTSAELAASCRELAARLMRTDDPSYHGLLDIVASRRDMAGCSAVVRGSAKLNGSLIGIGRGPLPLTT